MTRDPMFGPRKKSTALPVLPFAGHSGSMGSPASAQRALREDEVGVTEWRQRQVLQLLEQAGPLGMTYPEVGRHLAWHHGQSTGVLSPMHGAGLIAALASTRDNCTVYVLPEHVTGRETRDYGGGRHKALLAELRLLTAEHALLTTLEARLADVADRPDDAVVPVRLSTLRTLAGALARMHRLSDVP